MIRNLPRPSDTKKAGKMIKVRNDWDEIKNDVMLKCLRAKFKPGSNMTAMLLCTETALLIEQAPWDEYWGSGKHNTGLNWLGRLLMQVRDEVAKGP
jgi:ribA/ribD-fused uncharacterized protein